MSSGDSTRSFRPAAAAAGGPRLLGGLQNGRGFRAPARGGILAPLMIPARPPAVAIDGLGASSGNYMTAGLPLLTIATRGASLRQAMPPTTDWPG